MNTKQQANRSMQNPAGNRQASKAVTSPWHGLPAPDAVKNSGPIQPASCRLPPAARQRRGVLILVVLSLLVMFALMAMTYVLVASKQLTKSKIDARAETNATNPQNEVHAGFMEFLRGSTNPHSPIGVWNPFADMYGEPQSRTVTVGLNTIVVYGPNSVRGKLTAAAAIPTTGNQLVDLTATPRLMGSSPPTEVDELSLIEGYYEGSVLTMTSGPAKGLSTRIVRYSAADPNNTPTDYSDDVGYFRVMPFKGGSGTITPQQNDTFIVNGRPFSGTGNGYNTATGKLDARYSGTGSGSSIPEALLINPKYHHPELKDNQQPATYQNNLNDYAAPGPGGLFPQGIPFGGLGGPNEDYDAADYQNLHMSFVTTTGQVILPSFHRPDLINYMKNHAFATPISSWATDTSDLNGDSVGGDAQRLLRKICLRPTPADHPNFTGSNPYLDPTNAAAWPNFLVGLDPSGNRVNSWDVDNDGDGIPDSVWLDLGFPVRSTADGRKYKALFAFHVVDLDGRVNVNAHGSTMQVSSLYSSWDPTAGIQYSGFANSSAGNTVYLPRGMGVGPAEINLRMIFIATEVDNLLQGKTVGTITYDGRYGTEVANSTTILREAGHTDDASTYTNLVETDSLARVKRFQYPVSNNTAQSACSNPIDFWGRTAMGLDFAGQPYYWNLDKQGSIQGWKLNYFGETFDLPYDINLSRNAPSPGSLSGTYADDNQFTAFDLERILRPWDIDTTSMSPRLVNMATSSGSAQKWRNLVTTDSWDLPCPSIISPAHLRGGMPQRNLAEMAATLLNLPGALTTPQVNQAIRNLLAPELIAGRRMNINRPFGDGRDGNNNGIVDEPIATEATTEGSAGEMKAAYGTTTFDITNGQDVDNNTAQVGPASNDALMARQLMARHLYVLARLLMDTGYLPAFPTGVSGATDGKVQWYSEFAQGSPQSKELAIQRVAQWAVNVVDFMDPDNIMTPFEYDMYPFTTEGATAGRTWEVDGIIDNGTGSVSNDDTQPYRRLVWGCEAPAALLTETFNIHDRRVADTANDTSTKDRGNPGDTNKDQDLDQIRIPEGSSFFEIYATHNSNNAYFANNPYGSADLYTKNGNNWYLDLGRFAPAGNDGQNNNQYPVWRLAITKPHDTAQSVIQAVQSHPDSVSFEPRQGLLQTHPNHTFNSTFSLLPALNVLPNVDIERIVWFGGGATPSSTQRDGANVEIYYGRQFFNPYVANSALLPPGGYAVVGPRQITHIGSKPAGASGQMWGNPSDHKIDLNDVKLVTNETGTIDYPAVGSQIKRAVGIVAAAPTPTVPTAWTDPALVNAGIGISVSEPLPNNNYYSQPTNVNPATSIKDAYGNLMTGIPQSFLDAPLEVKANTLPMGATHNGIPLTKTGTKLNYRTVFLQRLANPLVPYHPLQNPYLTVDWMPIDLTVFNGEDFIPGSWDGNITDRASWDSEDSNPKADEANSVRFGSRQRGQYSKYAATDNQQENIWSIWPNRSDVNTIGGEPPIVSTNEAVATTANFRHVFHNQMGTVTTNRGTLGYLNHGYGDPMAANDPRLSAMPAALSPANYIGSPKTQPFPWLTWNNRPFANLAELMLVPVTHSGRLTLEFSLAQTANNPYNESGNAADQRAPYAHLLNMLGSSKTIGNTANFAQVLEYLQVPSPFVGTETVLNPQTFQWSGGIANSDVATGTAGFHPPFNTVSNYRDPGRVNINSIAGEATGGQYTSEVWNALLGGNPAAAGGAMFTPTFDAIAQSRQGYPGAGYVFDNRYPSIFGNPFRTAAGADLVPPIAGLTHNPINSTLWRADGNDLTTIDSTGKNPLFYTPPAAGVQQYNDPTRSAYFAYQNLGRVGNNLTTRSNVYAVWVTVGYFEVTPQQRITPYGTANEVYPDGYELGQELGSDTGEVTRHRGFYIFDRSIPVGYERGQDHNVLDAVLLRRFIE